MISTLVRMGFRVWVFWKFVGSIMNHEGSRAAAVAAELTRALVASPKIPKPMRVIGSKKTLGPPESVLSGPDGDVRRTLPVIEESLQVTKELVDRGGYRITKKIETSEQLVDELLRSEHVEIERRAINTAIAGDAVPGIRQEGDTLIVPVIEEILITVKRLILVEEVRITRKQTTERKPQTYTLRKERIEVERLAAELPSTVKAP